MRECKHHWDYVKQECYLQEIGNVFQNYHLVMCHKCGAVKKVYEETNYKVTWSTTGTGENFDLLKKES